MVFAAEVGEELTVTLDGVGAPTAGEAVVASHVHTEQFTVGSLRHARGATDERLGSRRAGDRDQHPLAGLPRLSDVVTIAVALETFVDAVREPQQRKFPQRREVAGTEIVGERGVDPIRLVHVAVGHAPPQRFGRHVDEFDLVGCAHDPVWDGFSLLHPGDAFDDIVDGFEVLDVQGRDDVKARVEQLFDILPAFLVSRTRYVRMGQLVDQYDVGTPSQDGVDVHLVEVDIAVVDLAQRQDLEVAELLRGSRPPVGLDDADDDVRAPLVASATLVEHRERLADAWGRTQI